MDFGNTPKLAPASTAAIVPRSDVVAVSGSVAVDLAPEKTVQSAQAGDAVRVDIRQPPQGRSEATPERGPERRDSDIQRFQDDRAKDLDKVDLSDVIESRLVIEPKTRTVVMQKTNVETGETVQTLPDEVTLKLRRYSRELTERARVAEDATARYVERTA